MSWVKIDTLFPSHAKVSNLSDKAFRTWVKVLCFCGLNTTDGHMTANQLADLRVTPTVLRELLGARLWEPREGGGIIIHDYLKYQPSKAKVQAYREDVRSRVKRHREQDCNTVTDEEVTEPETGGVTGTRVSSISSGSESSPDPEDSSALTSSSDLTGSARVGRKARQRKPETPYPEGFLPNEADLKCALKLRLDEPYHREFFRDKALEKNWLAVDWHARYRNYLRKVVEFAAKDGRSPGNGNGRQTEEHRRPYHELFPEQAPGGPSLAPAEQLQALQTAAAGIGRRL